MLFVPFLDFDRAITGLFLKRNSREIALPFFILTRDKYFYFLGTDRYILYRDYQVFTFNINLSIDQRYILIHHQIHCKMFLLNQIRTQVYYISFLYDSALTLVHHFLLTEINKLYRSYFQFPCMAQAFY